MFNSDYSSELEMMDGTSRKKPNKTRVIVLAVVIACSGFLVGFLIGWFGKPEESPAAPEATGPCLGENVPDKIIQDGEPEIREKMFAMVDEEQIRENLRKWSSYSHMAGTPGDERLADELYDTWTAQGLDRVTKVTYDVLLSFPDTDNPSLVSMVNSDTGEVLFNSQTEEPPLDPTQNRSDIIPPFNAYSPPGNVTGDLVYVNYATIEDFRRLENLSISVDGSIAIAKYGQIFRGDKARLAEEFGAIGLILYTDPADYSDSSVEPYPDSWWLPETGVQRGTIFPDNGDPLTPGYPSRDYSYRMAENETLLPKIPVHPISFGDAQILLSNLTGDDAPGDWQGGLNFTYKLGPGFGNSALTTRLAVTSENKMSNASNVIAFIDGSVEPDRYVVLGNHRDAWVMGAVDPTSGTAAMMELSRVLSTLVREENWRPRRTIVFCSWGAEEYALIGSYEWVEEFAKVLGERTIAYLNVDIAVHGNDSVEAQGVPLLYDLLYDASSLLPTPNDEAKTLYDEWLETFPGTDYEGNPTGRPSVGGLGAGSDYAGFMAYTGISSSDVRFTYSPARYDISDYPLYHSAYETFYLVEKYIDPDFEYSAAVTRFWGEMARQLADSYVLPLNVTAYAEALFKFAKDLESGYGDLMEEEGITLDKLYEAVDALFAQCKDFQVRLQDADRENPIEIRTFNEQMVQMERAFLDPAGLPLRPLLKHVVFAPSLFNAYAGSTFPGLVDLMYEIEGSDDAEERWELVRKHLAAIIFAIHSAANVLDDPRRFS